MNKDILDCTVVGTGPVTLDIVMARELGWSREVIESLARAITMLVRGAGMTMAFRTGRGCEHCGEIQGIDPDCNCKPAGSRSKPEEGSSAGEGWTMCGNCGNCNEDAAESCSGCDSPLTPVVPMPPPVVHVPPLAMGDTVRVVSQEAADKSAFMGPLEGVIVGIGEDVVLLGPSSSAPRWINKTDVTRILVAREPARERQDEDAGG